MRALRKTLPAACAVLLLGCAAGGGAPMHAQEVAAALPDAPVQMQDAPQTAAQTAPPAAQTAPPPAQTPAQAQSEREQSEQQLRQQEHQRILGVVPNFNTVNGENVPPLSAGQKFRLAFHSALDPFTFVAAGVDAGYSQSQRSFPAYGQGAEGFGKYFGASYADSFDGTLWGNAIFPALLHQDPRYFRKGTGSFGRRLWYSISTTVWTKNDNGSWGPNYSNVAGNIVAGGISNLYYPSAERGVGLTFERAFTVTAEGAIGAVAVEFWPDISRKLFHGRGSGLAAPDSTPPDAPPASPK